jgi:hypothetical protein
MSGQLHDRPLYPRGKSSWCPLNTRLGEPPEQTRTIWRETNILPLHGIEPRIFGRLGSSLVTVVTQLFRLTPGSVQKLYIIFSEHVSFRRLRGLNKTAQAVCSWWWCVSLIRTDFGHCPSASCSVRHRDQLLQQVHLNSHFSFVTPDNGNRSSCRNFVFLSWATSRRCKHMPEYRASNGTVADERRTGKYLEGSGRDLI